MQIARYYGIDCKTNIPEKMHGDSGEIIMYQNQIYILVDKYAIPARQRYTVMHELGHFLLGHLGNEVLSRSEHECKPSEEQAADKFAIDMLAPACVLWGLHLHTPEEIAQVCNISMQAAIFRAERMKLLYDRNKFLSHPLERQVFAQFSTFIKSQQKNNYF